MHDDPPPVAAWLCAVDNANDDYWHQRISEAEHNRRLDNIGAELRNAGYSIDNTGKLVALCAW